MRRFTQLLLLAACALLRVLPSFANNPKALHPTVKHNALRKGAVIRGLLDTRQNYYYCSSGYYECSSTTCCPGGWPCCRDGSCCDPASYCVLASNGVVGCCPNGELCSGPVGDPNTIYPSPNPPSSPTQTTNYYTSTIANSDSTSTTTFTTLLGGPTQSAEDQIIEVSVLDANINWSQNWVQKTSSCSPSITSKSTSTGGSSFTYIFQYASSYKYGFYYYFNVVNYNTVWQIFIDGVLDHTCNSLTTTDCTYSESYFPTPNSYTSASQNFTVVVHGMDDPSVSGPWSLEFNKLLIKERIPSSTSTAFGGLGGLTQTQATSTGLSALSAAGRVEPYRPLLVFVGILLTVRLRIL